MRKILCSAVLSLSILPLPALAQEISGCFMVDSAGRMISLSHICPQPAATIPSATSTSAPSVTSAFQYEDPSTADPVLLADYYASKYCDWREAGGRSREESRTYARSELARYLVTIYGSDGSKQVLDQKGVAMVGQIDSAIQQQCPGEA